MLRNIAPVAPEAVLQRIEDEIGKSGAALLDPKLPHRWQLTMIFKSLAYDPALFDRASRALASFVAAEAPNQNHDSASGAFKELFQLHLSGTHALPAQRRGLVRALCKSNNPGLVRCGLIGLKSLLHGGHFSASSNFDFGARPRDFGWHPPTYGDIWNWYSEAISLAVELSKEVGLRPEIRKLVSGALREIVGIKACHDAIDAAIAEFLKDGEWLDGWFAIRGAIRFDESGWQPEVKGPVRAMERALRPSNPINEARAYVLESRGSGFDLLNGDEEEEKDYAAAWQKSADRAQAIGSEFGSQVDLLSQFLPEVLSSNHAPRAFSFGVGLAQSTTPPKEIWHILRSALTALPAEQQNASVLGGFLHEVQRNDTRLCASILDDVLADNAMVPHIVYLQAQAGIDATGIERLRKAISAGVDANRFYTLASGLIRPAPQGLLAGMLLELAAVKNGSAAALEILHMAIYCLKSDAEAVESTLLDLGHSILLDMDLKNASDVREHRVQQTIKYCYAGPGGEQAAKELCQRLKRQIEDRWLYAWQLDYIFDAIFETQPLVALDELLLGDGTTNDDPIYGGIGLSRESPLEKVSSVDLWQWADVEPSVRYPLIGRSLNVFVGRSFAEEEAKLSPLFVEGLDRSPDRSAYLAGNTSRLGPSGWSGNLSVILDRRRQMLAALSQHEDETVRTWVAEQSDRLKSWADAERQREAEHEETFE